MAPVPFPFEYEPSPSSFPALLRRVWLRLYPHGEDLVFQVYREKLADFVHEYRAEVFMFTSSTVGSLSRSAKEGPLPHLSRLSSMLPWLLSSTCVSRKSGCRLTQVFLTIPP